MLSVYYIAESLGHLWIGAVVTESKQNTKKQKVQERATPLSWPHLHVSHSNEYT